jgi:hypothetical protein
MPVRRSRPPAPDTPGVARAIKQLRAAERAARWKRRRCALDTCKTLFKPVRENQRFCSPAHRNEYHLKPKSFRKLKDEIFKLIEEALRSHVQPAALVLDAFYFKPKKVRSVSRPPGPPTD